MAGAYAISDEERQRRSERMRALIAMKQKRDEPPPVASRMTSPLLRDWAEFLFERLKGRFPHLSQGMFFGWLNSCLESNEFIFVQSTNAVGMAQLVRSPLQPQNDVQEVFVLTRGKGYDDEALAIYDAFRRWAEHIGARDLMVDIFTDLERDLIQRGLGRLYNRVIPFVRLSGE